MGTQSQTSAPTPSSSNRHHHNGSNCPTPILLHPGRGGPSRAAHPHRGGGRRKHPVLVGGLPGREPQPVVHRLRHLHSGDPHVHGHRSARSHLLRRRFMNQLAKLWNEYPRFRLVTKTVMFIIGGFFLDALRQVYMLYDATSVYGTTGSQVPNASGYTLNKDAYLGFYKAERNAYLCGTTIFLFFMLYRFAHMTATLTLLENKLASLESTSTTHYRTERQIKDDVGRPIKNKIR